MRERNKEKWRSVKTVKDRPRKRSASLDLFYTFIILIYMREEYYHNIM